jgi:hypothetical protein
MSQTIKQEEQEANSSQQPRYQRKFPIPKQVSIISALTF